MRIAPVFGIGLDRFFVADGPGAVLVRAGDRLRFPEMPQPAQSTYDFESLDFAATGRGLNAYLAEFRPGCDVRLHAHDAAEFVFVLSGQLMVQVAGVDYMVGTGDSLYIHPSVPHGYARQGSARCTALVVTTAAPAAAAYEGR